MNVVEYQDDITFEETIEVFGQCRGYGHGASRVGTHIRAACPLNCSEQIWRETGDDEAQLPDDIAGKYRKRLICGCHRVPYRGAGTEALREQSGLTKPGSRRQDGETSQ
jgi:hypothetical protein